VLIYFSGHLARWIEKGKIRPLADIQFRFLYGSLPTKSGQSILANQVRATGRRQTSALFEEIIFLAFVSVIWHHLGVTIEINDYLLNFSTKLLINENSLS